VSSASNGGVPYSRLTIGVPKEIHHTERRVAISPANARLLTKQGFKVVIEDNAGFNAKFLNEEYVANGAEIAANSTETLAAADIVLKVRPPLENKELGRHEVEMLKDRSTLISFLWPAQNRDLVDRMVAQNKGLNVFAMDAIPRISRAQTFDALSSMANIAGYKSVGAPPTLSRPFSLSFVFPSALAPPPPSPQATMCCFGQYLLRTTSVDTSLAR
jgi:NAD/NADP transhydrogenase alpha subunit